MTVKELTKKLQQFDEDKEVRLAVYSEPTKLDSVELTTVYKQLFKDNLYNYFWSNQNGCTSSSALEECEVVVLYGEDGE